MIQYVVKNKVVSKWLFSSKRTPKTINIIIQSAAIWLRMIFQFAFKWHCLFIHFSTDQTQKKRIFIENSIKDYNFQRYIRSVKSVSSVLKICIYWRNCYVEACDCKKTRKECQKTNYGKCLKWPKVSWNTPKFKLQDEIFKLVKFCNKRITLMSWLFYPNWQGTKLIINYSHLLI